MLELRIQAVNSTFSKNVDVRMASDPTHAVVIGPTPLCGHPICISNVHELMTESRSRSRLGSECLGLVLGQMDERLGLET